MAPESIGYGFVIILLLLIANGFFVAIEFAIIAVRRSRIKTLAAEGDPAALLVEKMRSDIDRTVAGAQLGITIASLALGWVAEETIRAATALVFPEQTRTSAGIGMVLAFVVLSMSHVILGEQVPKSWSLRFPEKMLFFLIWPFHIFCVIASPIITVMNFLAKMLLKVFGVRKVSEEEFAIASTEEYQLLFEDSKKVGALSEDEHELLTGVLDLHGYEVKNLMVPRSEIVWINIKDPVEKIIRQVRESKHARILVGAGDLDKVIGYVQAHDVLSMYLKDNRLKLDQLIKQPLIVPTNKRALLALKDFEVPHGGVGVVLDEFGGVVGLFTLNDILSVVVGEHPAIFGAENPRFRQTRQDEWIMDGMLAIESFQEVVGDIPLPVSRYKYHTLAGLIIAVGSTIPELGQTIDWDGFQFTVLKMDRYRVSQVKVRRIRKNALYQAKIA